MGQIEHGRGVGCWVKGRREVRESAGRKQEGEARERKRRWEIWGNGSGFIDTKEQGWVKQGMPDHPLAASFTCRLAVLISYYCDTYDQSIDGRR